MKTQFGWHIIEAVGDIEEASTQALADVKEQISTTLLEEKKNTRINEWISELAGPLQGSDRLRARLRAAAGSRDDHRRGDTGGPPDRDRHRVAT